MFLYMINVKDTVPWVGLVSRHGAKCAAKVRKKGETEEETDSG